ncbi:hypothetical protein CC1G_00321 [Coprinopsis cinerea okayama7|uniref:MARVEL domain-containing protein n=1 Tax=Coprinopsis cinerea (strain Okayama-7 / 130 / ATCC MYA-4618 / FGSC 9003) TaxID=240176 RepID=A8NXJ4_COPC7|nr:hypothetical protein CC1G_00321 [Coprinopsis cinerea okayama7\|eukprot:XP_001837185.1 hypothetical protein CC1G_00321 [Coprinopsis cinerea okayama7\
MTVRFGNYRLAYYIFVMLLAGVVLGIGAHFASIFDAGQHSGFSIFTTVVASLNIFIFLLTLQWSQPRVEAFVLFVIGVLWLSLGAWSTDIIGHVQCDAIPSNQTIATKGEEGSFSRRTWCSEMKVVQAFSWALFALFVIGFYILFQLVGEARKFGRHYIWEEPIRELPWFGEMPGYYNTHTGPGPMPYPASGYPGGYPGYPAPSAGNAIMIQPGMNGAPPTITQVPMSSVPPLSP